ncbi:MAG TPA: radical SAM protein [Candidatus Polarisedimenticolia bacterium]|nr:radical SAM protein [Candidatus Polarisedimenticolia bacterium]
MKILLLYKSGRPGAGDFFARMMPVGLGWINATLCDAGFDSTLANLSRVPWSRVSSLLRSERPDLVGITLYTFNRHSGLRLAALAREANPRCVVIVGGPHATHVGDSILRNYPAVSAVAVGEGEITMLEAARAVQRGAPLAGVRGLIVRSDSEGAQPEGPPRRTGARETVANLDSLPIPVRHYAGHHLDPENEASFVITSRGCPARCTFCNTPDFWGTRMRFRSPEHMLEEFRCLRDTLGLVRISIRDDTFTVNRRRVIEFCKRLLESRLDVMWSCQSRVNAIDEERLEWMRRAGCDHIQYGVESGSERILKELAKDITLDEIRSAARATRNIGMTLSIYLISGVPGENKDDFRATESLVAEMRPHDGIVAPLAVFPGTHLYESLKAKGAVSDDDWVTEKRDTLYMMPGERGRRSFKRLTALCSRVGRGAAYTREELERHKSLLPDSFPTWIASGDVYQLTGDIGSALGEYEAVLEFSPDNLWALSRIGALMQATGDSESAALYFERALSRAPACRWLAALLSEASARRRPRAPRRRVTDGPTP